VKWNTPLAETGAAMVSNLLGRISVSLQVPMSEEEALGRTAFLASGFTQTWDQTKTAYRVRLPSGRNAEDHRAALIRKVFEAVQNPVVWGMDFTFQSTDMSYSITQQALSETLDALSTARHTLQSA
ncbi:MAG: hypothetical protein HY586_01505, partial [Candidatus Omnitrophica bacterium]|nr:hypothetical protein [Candidatus Omnitrophota bacterium]